MQHINFIIYLFYNYKTLNNHANHEYHKLALLKADRFLNICMQKEPEIINNLNEERRV
jgi:hypothetical protein